MFKLDQVPTEIPARVIVDQGWGTQSVFVTMINCRIIGFVRTGVVVCGVCEFGVYYISYTFGSFLQLQFVNDRSESSRMESRALTYNHLWSKEILR